jgi:hypothetical protein
LYWRIHTEAIKYCGSRTVVEDSNPRACSKKNLRVYLQDILASDGTVAMRYSGFLFLILPPSLPFSFLLSPNFSVVEGKRGQARHPGLRVAVGGEREVW